MVTAVTPGGGVFAVPVGGTAVSVGSPPFNGCYITNPLTAADQGIGTAEALYVNPAGAATVTGFNATVALQPGQTWSGIPGSTLPISVNAPTSGHRFAFVRW